MNNRKKIFASLLAFGVLFNVFSIPAFAADVTEGTEQIIRYEDGSYTVVTLTYDFSSVVSEKAAVKKTIGVVMIGIGIGMLLVLLLPLTGWLFIIGVALACIGLMWLAC